VIRDRLDLEDVSLGEIDLGAEGPGQRSRAVRLVIGDMLKHLCSAVSYGGAQSLQELRWAGPIPAFLVKPEASCARVLQR
jgi:hypothetical protein